MKTAVFCAISLLILLILLNGWVTEDAYITLRTVDNFVNGFGLRWNVSERVQIFTHPLWLFLLSAIYFFTREAYLTTLLTGFFVSLATIYCFCYRSSLSLLSIFVGLILMITSDSFLSFSTSGLENPLSHLLLLMYANHIRLYEHSARGRSLTLLSLCTSLLAMTRLDLMVLVLPSLVVLSLGNVKAYGKNLLLGFMPILLWELFSLFYFGSLFPNTAYAKLFGAGIPRSELSIYGLRYLYINLLTDPVTMSVIVIGMLKAWAHKDKGRTWVGFGILFQLIYTVSVGGDYMGAGRFLSSCFVFALPFAVEEFSKVCVRTKRVVALAGLTVLAAGLHSLSLNQGQLTHLAWQSTFQIRDWSPPFFDSLREVLQARIDQVRNAHFRQELYRSPTYKDNAFRYQCLLGKPFITEELADKGEIALSDHGSRYSDVAESSIPFYRHWNICEPSEDWRYEGESAALLDAGPIYNDDIGIFGYYAGINPYIIDDFGLSNALLARIPAMRGNYEIGHFYRLPPLGFKESIARKENLIANPHLARLFDITEEVTRGDLWSFKRLQAIFELNFHLSSYLSDYESTPTTSEGQLSAAPITFGPNGVLINLEREDRTNLAGIPATELPKEEIEIQLQEGALRGSSKFSVTYFSFGFRNQYTQEFSMDTHESQIIQVPDFITALAAKKIELNPLLQKDQVPRTTFQITHILLRPLVSQSFILKKFEFR